jgi:hypothetical protein
MDNSEIHIQFDNESLDMDYELSFVQHLLCILKIKIETRKKKVIY